jgi:hypothetical protein
MDPGQFSFALLRQISGMTRDIDLSGNRQRW